MGTATETRPTKNKQSKPNIEEAPEGSLQWYVEQHDKIKINKIKKNL